MSNWIKCTDKLPQNFDDVLTFDSKRNCIDVCAWIESGGEWIGPTPNGVSSIHGVTHWQPLPEPPEAE